MTEDNKLYFTKDTTVLGLKKILEKIDLNFLQKKSFVAIKVHFGEEGNNTFIPSSLYRPLIDILLDKHVLPFYTDTNTIYVGKRSNAIEHLILAEEHGFGINSTKIPVVIADGLKGNDYVEVEIGLNYFKTAKIASYIYYADHLICISHFKGHMMFGFAGSIKNLGMGCAARPAKYLLHNSLKPKIKVEKCNSCGTCIKYCPVGALSLKSPKIFNSQLLTLNSKLSTLKFEPDKCTGCGECIHVCPQKVFSIPWDSSYKEVQEKTVEYAYAVTKSKDKILYINILDNITKDCDCMKGQTALLKNVGILAGFDPVSIDFASLNIVNNFYKKDLFKEFWPEINYNIQLDYAERIGLGKKEYKIIEI